jgi:hypothetical protein
MKKMIPVLGALLGAWIFCTPAFADANAAAPHASYSPERSQHVAPPAWYGSATKGTVIYSTFNSDQSNLYNCCVAWTISTTQSILGFQQFVAMPFTPSSTYKLTSIQLALAYFAGANSLDVALAKDKGGMPGKTITSFTVTNVPPGGDCCDIEAVTPVGVKVKAGLTYWVVVSAEADTWGGWDQDSTGASGTFAFDAGSGWQVTSGTLAAFAVIGKLVAP